MPPRAPAMPGTPDSTPRREQPAPPCLPVRGRHLLPQQFCDTAGAARPKVLRAGTLVPGACPRDGVGSLMAEDPRQTRRNGSDPRTAQSRSATSGGGSSRHVLPRMTCAPGRHRARAPSAMHATGHAERPAMRSSSHGSISPRDETERRFPFTLGSQCVTAAKWPDWWPGQLRPAAAHRAKLRSGDALPGGACDVGGDDVGGVPVQAAAGALLIPHRGARFLLLCQYEHPAIVCWRERRRAPGRDRIPGL